MDRTMADIEIIDPNTTFTTAGGTPRR